MHELPPRRRSCAVGERWSLDKIDVNTILAGLDDRKSLESTLRDALVQAVIDEIQRQSKDVLGPWLATHGSE